MKLTWKPCFSTSALHGAFAIASGLRLTDSHLERAIASPALSIHAYASGLAELRSDGSAMTDGAAHQRRAKRLWEPLLVFSSEISNNQALANYVLSAWFQDRLDPSQADRLAGWITEIEAAMRLAYPHLEEQLELRTRPIRDLWDGYGNGLLTQLERMTQLPLANGDIEVIPVQPLLGGFGAAHPYYHKIRLEAVLANPISELPEVVRLAWLAVQVAMYQELSRGVALDAAERASLLPPRAMESIQPWLGLASLLPTLAAGQRLELATIEESHVALAIEQWQIPLPPRSDANLIKILFSWWETYLQTRPPVFIAIKALQKMLGQDDPAK